MNISHNTILFVELIPTIESVITWAEYSDDGYVSLSVCVCVIRINVLLCLASTVAVETIDHAVWEFIIALDACYPIIVSRNELL